MKSEMPKSRKQQKADEKEPRRRADSSDDGRVRPFPHRSRHFLLLVRPFARSLAQRLPNLNHFPRLSSAIDARSGWDEIITAIWVYEGNNNARSMTSLRSIVCRKTQVKGSAEKEEENRRLFLMMMIAVLKIKQTWFSSFSFLALNHLRLQANIALLRGKPQ